MQTGLLPVVTLPCKALPDGQRVQIALSNGTDKVMKYAVEPGSSALLKLDGRLFKVGEAVTANFITRDLPPLKMQHVRDLRPQSHVILDYNMPNHPLQPGVYELRLTYDIQTGSVYDTQFALTPARFKLVLLVSVTE